MSGITSDGFALDDGVLGERDLQRLEAAALRLARRIGRRNLLDDPEIRELVVREQVTRLVEGVVGAGAFPVRALLFDKTPASNWRVAFHQDLAIAVRRRVDVPGFSGWSVKAGVTHVLAPASILERMIAVRFHLDDCGEHDGPLRVLPGSHLAGRIAEEDIPAWRERVRETICLAPRGGLLLMRPLLLHASSSAGTARRRRVVHVEFAACSLPHGLEWRWGADVKESR